jgi:iron complex outermembrane recepter protein
MKRILLSTVSTAISLVLSAQDSQTVKDSFNLLTPVEVRALRAGENAPFTKTNISKKEIQKINLGQDIPFLLNQTPSVVINSDAGNGVGYTGIRIRGTDATRINMTINSIPYNDAESQGLFFVNLPDFSSSVNSVQVQRGLGTSSNGAGAFGASINFSTNEVNKTAYAEFNNSYGSFNTWKNTVKTGTGLLSDHFTIDARFSKINSDGFIDRAASDLKSLYLSTAYINNKSTLRFNLFTGNEKTYQAWYGISEADLINNNRKVNYAGTEKSGEPYNNETDNYKQNHYQLFFDTKINDDLVFNTAVFFTKGKGYYEQYKANQKYSEYNLPNPVYGNVIVDKSDFIRQLWLDNNFYGNIFSLQYKKNKTQLTAGGALTQYEGNHFGKLIWASNGLPIPEHKWYDLNAVKTDVNTYLKWQQKVTQHLNAFFDIQFRNVSYEIDGFRDNPSLLIKNQYTFLNPKAGLSYSRNNWNGYISYSVGNKEPNREDFEAGAAQLPRPEQLKDLEINIGNGKSKYNWSVTGYYMKYKNQLVLTGKINDVGAYTRTNIPESYRLGAELQAAATIFDWLKIEGNLTISRNKVLNFSEYIDDYDAGNQKINNYSSTDIAYSPNIIAGSTISLLPVKNTEVNLVGKYVSKQYLDNTQNESRRLNGFYTQDARIAYTFKKVFLKEAVVMLQANNLFDKKYEPNGYTFSYIAGGALKTSNYYFPMAGRNFMIGVNVKL